MLFGSGESFRASTAKSKPNTVKACLHSAQGFSLKSLSATNPACHPQIGLECLSSHDLAARIEPLGSADALSARAPHSKPPRARSLPLT
jgi:hypothetical protein